MNITLGVGLFWKGNGTYQELINYIKEIESLGYSQIWVSNEKFYNDMYIMATVVSENTSTIKIGTFVTDPYSYHPALTSMAISTLDFISNKRVILCMGAGGTGFPVMGINRIKPALAIKESIHVIRELFKGDTVDFHGEVIQCHNGHLNVLPPRKEIPVFIASRGNLVLEIGGEIADGVMIASYAEPEGVKNALHFVEKGGKKAGRNLKDLTIISRVDTCICKDRREAYDAVKPMVGIALWTSFPDRKFVNKVGLTVPDELENLIAKRDYNLMAENTHLIPDSFVDKFCWAGTVEEVAEKVIQIVKTGISNVTILPHPSPNSDIKNTVREFALSVKPIVDEYFNMTVSNRKGENP